MIDYYLSNYSFRVKIWQGQGASRLFRNRDLTNSLAYVMFMSVRGKYRASQLALKLAGRSREGCPGNGLQLRCSLHQGVSPEEGEAAETSQTR